MSRYEVIHDDKGLAFGNDHACGEFLMIWLRPADLAKRSMQEEFGPDLNEIIIDKDMLFDKDFNQAKMTKLIKLHGFKLSELRKAKRET